MWMGENCVNRGEEFGEKLIVVMLGFDVNVKKGSICIMLDVLDYGS